MITTINLRIAPGSGQPSVIAAVLADARLLQRVANAAAESYVDDTLDWIAAGKAFDTQPKDPGRAPGQLEGSIGWQRNGDGTAEVYANADYAGYVEEGTDAHVIVPRSGRKGLKIPVGGGGGYIVRRAVNHPGSKAHPFFFADQAARASHMQERALSVLAAAVGAA